MNPLLCNGCGRRIGWSPTRIAGFMYCTKECRRWPHVSKHEERDSLAHELSRVWTATRTARALGMSRQRVQQVVEERVS